MLHDLNHIIFSPFFVDVRQFANRSLHDLNGTGFADAKTTGATAPVPFVGLDEHGADLAFLGAPGWPTVTPGSSHGTWTVAKTSGLNGDFTSKNRGLILMKRPTMCSFDQVTTAELRNTHISAQAQGRGLCFSMF